MASLLLLLLLHVSAAMCALSGISITEIEPAKLVGDLDQLVAAASLNNMQNFPCGEPRPVVVNSSELLSASDAQSVRPHNTVVRRCDPSAGCCKNPHLECQPAEEEVIKAVYQLRLMGVRKPVYRGLAIVQHKKCHCVRKYRPDD